MQDPPCTTKGMKTSRRWRPPPWPTSQPAPRLVLIRSPPSAETRTLRHLHPSTTIPGATEKETSSQAPSQTQGTGIDDNIPMPDRKTSLSISTETTMVKISPCPTPPWPPSANASQISVALMTTLCGTCLLNCSSSSTQVPRPKHQPPPTCSLPPSWQPPPLHISPTSTRQNPPTLVSKWRRHWRSSEQIQ